MTNTYICLDCQGLHTEACQCGSGRQQALGDLHLFSKFVDVYINVQMIAGQPRLVIKKPSGQVTVELDERDLLPGF